MSKNFKNVFKGIIGELIHPKNTNDPLGLIESQHRDKKNTYQVLKRFGIYKADDAGDIFKSPAVSNLSLEYYQTFSIKVEPFPNSYPFAIVVSRDSINVISNSSSIEGEVRVESNPEKTKLQGSKNVIHIIDYEDESAYDVVYNLLTDLDKKILRIISEFRNVQYLQLLRELGDKTKRIERALERLNSLYLIQKFRFPLPNEVGKEQKYGYSYSIYSHGSYLLMKYLNLSPQYAFKWKEQQRRDDDFSPIRCWKIMDAYLNFRFHNEFVGFIPYSYLNKFTYDEEVGSRRDSHHRVASKSEERFIQSAATADDNKKITRLVRPVRFNGQILLHNPDKNRTTKFDLYPFITTDKEDSDLSRLETIFKHYGRFTDGLDSEGNKRFLLIIVDNPVVIELIEEEYRLSDRYVSLENILFMDLSESKEDFFSSIKRIKHLDNNNPELRTVQFKISDNI